MTDSWFDLDRFDREAGALSRDFATAKPFPHVVVDGLLTAKPGDVTTFPNSDWGGWTKLGDSYQANKRACDDITRIPEPMSSLIHELSTPRFLKALEEVTGIAQLMPDPYLNGGGIHLSGPGGILAPHTDFHHYRGLDLFRRVNVLIYLNEDWTEEDGGCLSLYDGDTAVSTVVPIWGRTVIFRTDDNSVHGFPIPVADGRWRRSVALYYYTSAPAREFSGDETTYWRQHGESGGAVRKVRMKFYRLLLNLSRTFSIAAHVVNPNQGMGLVRARLAERMKHRDGIV